MLKLKYFKFSDEKEINEFLNKNVLQGKANVLVANGTAEILIPYEDGSMPTPEQHKMRIMEDIISTTGKLETLVHLQKVTELNIKGVEEQLDMNNNALIKDSTKREDRESNKEHENEIKRLNNVLGNYTNEYLRNQAEITRLTTELTVYQKEHDDIVIVA